MPHCILHGRSAEYLGSHSEFVTAVSDGKLAEVQFRQYSSERLALKLLLAAGPSQVIDIASCCAFRNSLVALLNDEAKFFALNPQRNTSLNGLEIEGETRTPQDCQYTHTAMSLIAPQSNNNEAKLFVVPDEINHVRVLSEHNQSQVTIFYCYYRNDELEGLWRTYPDYDRKCVGQAFAPYSFIRILRSAVEEVETQVTEAFISLSRGQRRPEYETATVFTLTNNEVHGHVRKFRLANAPPPSPFQVDAMIIYHESPLTWPYIAGQVLNIEDKVEEASTGGFVSSTDSDLHLWMTHVAAKATCDEAGFHVLPGNCWDMVPQNMIKDSDGGVHAIDLEWVAVPSVAAVFVVWRGVWLALAGRKDREAQAQAISALLCNAYGLRGKVDNCLSWERAFQRNTRHVNF